MTRDNRCFHVSRTRRSCNQKFDLIGDVEKEEEESVVIVENVGQRWGRSGDGAMERKKAAHKHLCLMCSNNRHFLNFKYFWACGFRSKHAANRFKCHLFVLAEVFSKSRAAAQAPFCLRKLTLANTKRQSAMVTTTLDLGRRGFIVYCCRMHQQWLRFSCNSAYYESGIHIHILYVTASHNQMALSEQGTVFRPANE